MGFGGGCLGAARCGHQGITCGIDSGRLTDAAVCADAACGDAAASPDAACLVAPISPRARRRQSAVSAALCAASRAAFLARA